MGVSRHYCGGGKKGEKRSAAVKWGKSIFCVQVSKMLLYTELINITSSALKVELPAIDTLIICSE